FPNDRILADYLEAEIRPDVRPFIRKYRIDNVRNRLEMISPSITRNRRRKFLKPVRLKAPFILIARQEHRMLRRKRSGKLVNPVTRSSQAVIIIQHGGIGKGRCRLVFAKPQSEFRGERSGHRLGYPSVSLLGRQTIAIDRKSTRLNSSHVKISYAVF